MNPEAVVSMPDRSIFTTAGVDVTCLGFAQVTAEGNVNSSKFDRVAGCGGFIDISQNSAGALHGQSLPPGDQDGCGRRPDEDLAEGRSRSSSRPALNHLLFAVQRSQGQEVFYIT
jgi:acyl CoA:acetate/3-ketoacid CoA transferase